MTNQPQLDHIHEEVPPDYYAKGVERNFLQWLWHSRRKAVLRKVFDRRGGRLLDLGCHGGYMTNYLQQLIGGEVWGIDVSRPAIRYAREHYSHLHFRHGDVQQRLPFTADQFDWVTMFDVLEHLPRAGAAVREAHRVLKPGGHLVIAIPLEKKLLFKLMWESWKRTKGKVWKHVHVHQFSLADFRKFMERRRFKEVKIWRSHGGTYIVAKYEKQ